MSFLGEYFMNKNDFVNFNTIRGMVLDANKPQEGFCNFQNYKGIFVIGTYLRGFL